MKLFVAPQSSNQKIDDAHSGAARTFMAMPE
jgi:hypothetical protein